MSGWPQRKLAELTVMEGCGGRRRRAALLGEGGGRVMPSFTQRSLEGATCGRAELCLGDKEARRGAVCRLTGGRLQWTESGWRGDWESLGASGLWQDKVTKQGGRDGGKRENQRPSTMLSTYPKASMKMRTG